MGNIGATEIILILIIALVVFGPRRLPQIGRTVGKSLREFRKASQDIRDEFRFSLDDDEPPMVPSQPRAELQAEPDRPPEPRTTGPEGQVPVAATKRPAARKKPATRTGTQTQPKAKTKTRRSSTATARKPEQPA